MFGFHVRFRGVYFREILKDRNLDRKLDQETYRKKIDRKLDQETYRKKDREKFEPRNLEKEI